MVEVRSLAALPLETQPFTQRTPPLWQAFTRLVSSTSPFAPVAAGGNVYVYGFSPSDILAGKRSFHDVYAFDAKTGALRWKWELEDKRDAFLCDGLAADGNKTGT